MPRVELLIVCGEFVGGLASCLLLVIEEEAAWFLSVESEKSMKFYK